ncbi:hypothetical protein HYC85_009648 [Camellia sinensis]|uniref:Uncharacterized protein n=1 Tax=Camellia sinensis TaxID=4442 RepID=A0A7J7HI94_CAMSI|nr:hypothetical protein HYC85_009648 [Camellia sinensis]
MVRKVGGSSLRKSRSNCSTTNYRHEWHLIASRIVPTMTLKFYIPELADTIIKRNKEVDPILMIQLKGIMIGNGIMNDRTDDIGRLDYSWSHSLISVETYRGLLNHCIMTPNDTKKCK